MNNNQIVRVADNSGARFMKIIKILRKSPRGQAALGDIVIGSVQKINPAKRVKKGQILRAMLIRSAKFVDRFDGQYFRFQSSAVVIIDKNCNPKSTKIHGPTSREIRKLGFIRIISLSTLAI
ncbi:MAG: 50S ribosomal protein L14 [Rickettsiaceae bacterium]|nr:MAG: 50S ribosomal protein L14 [Rickettsiaceae bacterium]